MQTLLIKTKPALTNHKHIPARGRLILNPEYREVKEAIAWEIQAQTRGELLTEDGIAVNILVYYSGRKPDIDAYEKILLDAMTGIIYKDDGLIDEKHTFRIKVEDNPRVEIQIL